MEDDAGDDVGEDSGEILLSGMESRTNQASETKMVVTVLHFAKDSVPLGR
jgi:hypothetical protein